MRKIKVLQIGGNTQKNGITTFLLSSYKLMRDDYIFIFINTAFRESNPEVLKTIEEYGGKIYHLPYEKNTSDIEDELKKIVATEQPDVIHCHYFYSNGDFMRIGFEMDIPIRIAHCLNDKSGYLNKKEQQMLIRSRELTYKYATLRLAVSQNAERFCYGDDEFEIGHLKDKYMPCDAYIKLAKEYMLGSAEHYGDRKKVVIAFKKAHELGNLRGSFYYALQFFEGSGVDKDINFAVTTVNAVLTDLEIKASSGQAEFIVIIADMYSFGLGKPQSYEQAMAHYLKAANLGNLEAMCDLGYMYSVGQGVEKDLEKSFYWYLKSAELGYLHSMRDVGQAYYFGIGTTVDYKEAVNWFKKASALNYSHATCDLALCYLEGHGVKKSLTKAAEAYMLALKQDEPRAVRDLIAHSIDVEELLSSGKIKFIKRYKIDVIDRNNFANGTIVINAHIKSIEPSIFYDCRNIIKFFVEKENPYFKAYNGVLYSKNGEMLIRFPLGSPIAKFTVPDHVKHIGAHAFQNCYNLQSVKLHNCIETIGDSAFDDCKRMEHIKLPQSIVYVGAWAFHACDKIEEFIISASLTKIGKYAFGSCESLKKITVSLENSNYTSKDGNLYTKDLSSLLQYAIGKTEKLFVLPKETKTITFRAFSDACRLECVDVCSATKIEEKAFYYCSNLKEVLLDKTCIIDDIKTFDKTAEGFSVIHRKRGRTILLADIHGHLRLDFAKEKLSKLKLQAEDVVVILGDAGIVWQEPVRTDIKEFYTSLPCDLLFLDGNHENFDLLKKMKTVMHYGSLVHEIFPNVFHLLRGQAYLINGKKCFVFGGAYSNKRENNSSPVHTWESELPNSDEYQLGCRVTTENENRFDLIFTHQAPRSLLDSINYNYANAETELLDYLETLKNEICFDKWYFGHIHKDLLKGKFMCLYENCEVIE